MPPGAQPAAWLNRCAARKPVSLRFGRKVRGQSPAPLGAAIQLRRIAPPYTLVARGPLKPGPSPPNPLSCPHPPVRRAAWNARQVFGRAGPGPSRGAARPEPGARGAGRAIGLPPGTPVHRPAVLSGHGALRAPPSKHLICAVRQRGSSGGCGVPVVSPRCFPGDAGRKNPVFGIFWPQPCLRPAPGPDAAGR